MPLKPVTQANGKTVRPMLPVRCLSVLPCHDLSVCNVDVLLPNGWTDQDKTWHACRSRSGGGPAPPPPKGHSPQFSARAYCGQTVAHLSYY